MAPGASIVEWTPQALADAVDHLVSLALGDPECAAPLANCREKLRAVSWERFRLRHEQLSRDQVLARRRAAFVRRHRGDYAHA